MSTVIKIDGVSWGFLDDPPPRCHLATLDRGHVIWLEDAGDRLLEDANEEVQPERGAKIEHVRELVERAWIQKMMRLGWLNATWISSCGDVVLEAYAGTINWFGIVLVHEQLDLPISHDRDVTIDEVAAELVLLPGQPQQRRIGLPNLLWSAPTSNLPLEVNPPAAID